MHAIHTTPGFIIGSRPSGEAGKLLFVFTRDLGLVLASAQGIRFEKSKLRPFAQDYSFGQFSFVRGKEFWRLTNAQERNMHTPQELTARVASLLERLLHGEEAHPGLFDCIQMAMRFLSSSSGLDAEDLQTLESLVVIRMLYHLGYVGDIADLNGHISSSEISSVLLEEMRGKRVVMNQHINKALRESHL